MEPGLLRAEGLDTISIEGVPLLLVDPDTAHPGAQGRGGSVIESGEFPVILSTILAPALVSQACLGDIVQT
jgi:hypothetical protein